MTSRRFSGPQWPDAAQELLLRVALTHGSAAVDAWRRWRELVPFDVVDGASLAVVPLAAQSLQRAGYTDDLAPRLRGIGRQTWLRNRVLVAGACEAVRLLDAAGIPVMALKGVALLETYYGRDYAVRPMGDADLFVRGPALVPALEALRPSGWVRHGPWSIKRALARMHEAGLRRGPGETIDLHWRPLDQSWDVALDEGTWARSRVIQIDGTSVRVNGPEDLFLHVIVHGARGHPQRLLRWVVDAARILGAEPGFDWGLVCDQAKARRLTVQIATALRYLRRFGIAVPDHVVEDLERVRPSLAERVDRDLGPRRAALVWQARFEAASYLRRSAAWPWYRRAAGIPGHVAVTWDVPLARVPGEGVRRLALHRRRQAPSPPPA